MPTSKGASEPLRRSDTAYMLGKGVLRKLIEFSLHVVVVAFTHSANLREAWLSNTIAHGGERRERILRLTNGDDVADDA